MSVLTSIWSFVKTHWQVIAICMIVIVGYVWIKRQQTAFADTLVQVNTAHQVEVDQINAARAAESAQHKQELEALQASIAKIQADYAAAQQALQVQQTQEQVQIVKKYGNDSAGLAALTASKFGFVVITPPNQ